MIQSHRGRNQRCEAKVNRERNGPVAHQPDPARDKRENRFVGLSNLIRPVIWASGGWVARSKFGEGDGDTFIKDEDDNPAKKDGELATAVDCTDEGATFTKGNGSNGEGLEQEGEQGPVAL